MDLSELLMNSGNSGAINQMGSRLGLDENQTMSALQQLIPALGAGLQRNVSSEGGVESLINALSSGRHAQYLDNPELMDSDDTVQDGNGILGHLFGSKDVSRQVAANASANTGIGADVMRQMLPLAATMLMGALAKRNASPAASEEQGLMGMLTPMLDSNRDGSISDDVIGLIGRFMTSGR